MNLAWVLSQKYLARYLDSAIELPLSIRAEGTLPDFQEKWNATRPRRTKDAKKKSVRCE